MLFRMNAFACLSPILLSFATMKQRLRLSLITCLAYYIDKKLQKA